MRATRCNFRESQRKNTTSLRGSYLDKERCRLLCMMWSNLGLEGFLARDEEKRGGLIKSAVTFRWDVFNKVGQSTTKILNRRCRRANITIRGKRLFFASSGLSYRLFKKLWLTLQVYGLTEWRVNRKILSGPLHYINANEIIFNTLF